MVLRFLSLLLAVILMTSAAAQAFGASGAATASQVDAPDAPDLDPAVLPESSVLAPIRVTPCAVTPASPSVIVGRGHAVLVFRPPRLSASR